MRKILIADGVKTMIYRELIEQTACSIGATAAQTERLLDSFFDVLLLALQAGGRVDLREDFGCFVVKERGGQLVDNGQNMTKLQQSVAFKAAAPLKKTMRQSESDYLQMLRDCGLDKQAQKLENDSPP